MGDFNRRSARIQLYGLVAALVLAGLIAVGITIGAFVLSFSAQRDLARQGDIAPHLTWIFPAIVDGAILGSTISVVVLSKLGGKRTGRNFFVFLAVVVVFISVYGNAFHAWHRAQEVRAHAATVGVASDSLTPTAAALIAVIPPLLVLAFTHGVGILVKAIGAAYAEYTEAVRDAQQEQTGVAQDEATRQNLPERDATTTEALRGTWPAPVGEETAGEDVTAVVARPEPAVAADVAQPASPLPEPVAVLPEPVAQSREAVAPSPEPVAYDEWETEPVAAWPEPVAQPREVVAPAVEPVAQPVAVDAAAPAAVAAPPMAGESHRTVAELLDFIDAADLDPAVKLTARLKINNPDITFAALAAATDTKHAATAMRRYKKAEDAALAAGFTVPPLPDLEDGRIEVAAEPALAMSR